MKQILIRTMNPDDVKLGIRLGAQNNWNQLEADWLRFLAMQPDGCFVAERNGEGMGTAAACIFDSVAWVAMVLVDNAHRRQGIGTALMEHVLQFLDERRVPSIRLDATPLGRPIYERIGFVAEYELLRFDGVLPSAERDQVAGAPVTKSDLPKVIRLDNEICATDRTKFLTRLYGEVSEQFQMIREGEKILAYCATRPGFHAMQIGPCVGAEDAAVRLLADCRSRHGGKRVYIDIPTGNKSATNFATDHGLQVQRALLRMGRGVRVQENLAELFASSGPEKG